MSMFRSFKNPKQFEPHNTIVNGFDVLGDNDICVNGFNVLLGDILLHDLHLCIGRQK